MPSKGATIMVLCHPDPLCFGLTAGAGNLGIANLLNVSTTYIADFSFQVRIIAKIVKKVKYLVELPKKIYILRPLDRGAGSGIMGS